MSDDLERKLGDMLADGKITDGDAEQVRMFSDFLKVAGPPSTEDGQTVADRLVAAGRQDLLDWARGVNEPPPGIIVGPRRAATLRWCHVFDGKVHVGFWTPDDGGYLTTMSEDADGVLVCDKQTGAPLGAPHPPLSLWRDRTRLARSLGIEVCQQCEADLNETDDLNEVNRSDW